MSIADISAGQLLLCLFFVVLAGTGSAVFRLSLERDLAWGTVRTFAQLFLVGYVLKIVFAISSPWLVLLLYLWMIFWAAQTIYARVKERQVRFFVPTFVSMTVSYMLITTLVTSCIIQVRPWYTPQYFIPIGGMIIGNSMNAVTIALERMFREMKARRGEVELALCLGATPPEATQELVREVVRAGMIPAINALMTVGLVSLPGMMTGQILAGTDPLVAVKYQIVVMLMLVASTAVGCILVVLIVRNRCFTAAQQLRL